MRTVLALLFLAVLPVAYAGKLETLKGKLEQDSGKYVLTLPDAYTLKSGDEKISTKRLQVEGWTVADIPKLEAAKGKKIKLTGYVYPGTPAHVEKLVISVTSVPGDGPIYQTVIITDQPVEATPIARPTKEPDHNIPHPPFQTPPTRTPPKILSQTKAPPPILSQTRPPPPPNRTQNSILGSWITEHGVHDYSATLILQFSDDYTGRIVNKPSGSRVKPNAYRFKWRIDKNSIWINLLDGRYGRWENERGNWDIISISPSALKLDLGDEIRTFTKAE